MPRTREEFDALHLCFRHQRKYNQQHSQITLHGLLREIRVKSEATVPRCSME